MMRLRFAPSPTGNLHIGSVRTALFNWVFSRHEGATFVLRIEDTDQQRSKPEFETNILEGLKWLGLDYDEGPDKVGDYGPYRQSERMESGIYQDYVEKLLADKKAYYCFETEEELESEREAAKARGEAYQYSGKSWGLSDDEVQKRLANGEAYTIRFRLPEPMTVVVEDLVRGAISFDTSLLSDFIILKSDGSPAYNFAVVVDDIGMAITHVIRGEDHISNTPRQILLYQALGAAIPKFAHLPIILGPDKSKLSKRHGAMAVTDYQDMGYLPHAVLNYLSLLGWSPPDEKELLSSEELISCFDIRRISKSGAIFDESKLKWMNGQYIRQLDKVALYEVVAPYFSVGTLVGLDRYDVSVKPDIVMSVQDNLELLSDINTYLEPYLMTDDDWSNQNLSFSEQDHDVLTQFKNYITQVDGALLPDHIQTALDDILEQTGLGKGKVLKPIRLACTGLGSGPHLPLCLSILGRDILLLRLGKALGSEGND